MAGSLYWRGGVYPLTTIQLKMLLELALCPTPGGGDQWSMHLCFPGCCTAEDPVTGPEEVSGQEQGSLTVQCRYDSGWKDYKKYWCRGAYWKSCEILVETDASEQLVKENRVSIRDDQTDFIFTVTMEDLRMSDADIYWCGITKAGTDPMFKVNVNIDPGKKNSEKSW